MTAIAYSNPLRFIDSTTKIYRSYEEEVCKIYGIPRAMFVEWIAYHCNENLKKGLEFSVYHTQKNLSTLFKCSRATLNNWIKRLKEDEIIIVDKDLEHNCRQNAYTLGPKYYEILEQREPLSVQQLDRVCPTVRQSVSNSSTPLKIYNIHTKTEKNNVVFFPEKIIEVEKTQEMPPCPPVPTSEPLPFPLPMPEPEPADSKEQPKKKPDPTFKTYEDKAFEEQWKLYSKKAPNYGIESAGSKLKARKQFGKVYREEGPERSMFLMIQFFEWKDDWKKKKGSCTYPPHLEKFYRDNYYKNEALLEFIKDTTPTEPTIEETKIQASQDQANQKSDNSENSQFRRLLLEKIGIASYNSWFKEVELKKTEDYKLLIKAKGRYYRDSIKNNPSYCEKVKLVAKEVFPGFEVEYVCD